MTANKFPARNTLTVLIIGLLALAAISAMPVAESVLRLAYRVTCSYYQEPPRWSIIRLFDNYAECFEEHLVKKLDYSTPADLTAFIHSHTTLDNPIQKALDLGCGTGLLGKELIKQFNIQHLTGVDFSAKMLQKSKTKGIYQHLQKSEILEYLQQNDDAYDLITAADVLIYFGELKPLMQEVHQHLKDGGYFAFSVESLATGTFKLSPAARFQHSLAYLQKLSAEIGFRSIKSQPVALRKDYGVVIAGDIVLLQK